MSKNGAPKGGKPAQVATSDETQASAQTDASVGAADHGKASADASDGQPELRPQPVMLKAMKRDPEQYPDGPHAADVHPDMVDEYRTGGWDLV